MRRRLRFFVLTMCLPACGLPMLADSAPTSPHKADTQVTVLTGESWLNHLHRSFGDTSMGKTGQLGPPAPEPGTQQPGWQLGLLPSSTQALVLQGADLYRLNCQGCHGEGGLGAPPEINSLIDPVRATSVRVVLEKMRSRGLDMSAAEAAELAKESQQALLQRLHSGGQSMPPFSHLSDTEIRSLIAYLNQLANVPGAAQIAVPESPMRVGELIAKSTCHICHDANGPNPTPQQLENGAIPPLETLTTRVNQLEFIRKVTGGAPIVMGTPPTPHRGRMPVFHYLSRNEAADVYVYLTSYPPSAFPSAGEQANRAQQPKAEEHGAAPAWIKAGISSPPLERAEGRPADGIPDWAVTAFLAGAGVVVFATLMAALAFVAFELKRLGNPAAYQASYGERTQQVAVNAPELAIRYRETA